MPEAVQPTSDATAPRVWGVLLAAGSSTRFGADNKLLAVLDGLPLVRHVGLALAAAPIAGMMVVTGPDADQVAAALDGLDARFVHNARHRDGMAGSLATGISALPAACEGALVITGDMPRITAGDLGRLIRAFCDHGGQSIVFAATASGQQRNPVLWPRRHFETLSKLSGAVGGKAILQAHRATSVAITVDESHIVDIDTREELERLQRATDDDRA